MSRRIKSRKRKHLGNRSYGGGNAKNRRGKGNKGGKGNAGFHKHNWLRTIKRGEHKNRKYGFSSVRSKLMTVTLEQISTGIAAGKYPVENGMAKVLLPPGSKVVAGGKLLGRAFVHASSFSEGARKKIEDAGGKAEAQAKKAAPAPKQPAGTMPKAVQAPASKA